jgi:hypothetical protein
MADFSSSLVIAVRFPRLYSAVRGTAQELLRFVLDEVGNPPHWPERISHRLVFDSSTASHVENYSEESPAETLRTVRSMLEPTASYKNAVTELKLLREQNKAVPSFFPVDDSFLIPLLADYLDRQRTLEFDERIFHESYSRVEDYIGNEQIESRLYILLWGMSGPEAEVKLSKSHRIYRVDEAEIQRLWKLMIQGFAPLSFWGMGKAWPHAGAYLLEATFACLKSDIRNFQARLSEEIAKSVTAMRLSSIGSSLEYLTYENLSFFPLAMRMGFPETVKAGGWLSELTETTCQSFKQLWPTAYEL